MLSEPRAQTADDFQVLVAAHRAGLWRVAYRLTGNRDDAEDLLQESLIEAFQAFGRFQMGTAFERWVYRIMTRTFIDKFRRRKRLGSVPLEEISRHGQMSQLADFSMDPQQISERTEWSEPVQAALSRLAPAFRAVVIMCDAEGLSYEEASRVLACPMGTVRSRLHRARDQLRSWLRPVLRPMRGG
jgi:RNA polymerase sigma-70 factor (ECF subfamily)